MRPPVPSHKTVYLRFHKRIDACLTELSEKTGMRRATAVTWIQNRYMTKLMQSGVDLTTLRYEDLGFGGEEEAYFIELGRGASGSVLGRAMQITVDRAEDRMIELLAMQNQMSTRNFRTAILVAYFREIGIL